MGIITFIKNYFREALEELKKVIWPSRKETIKHTLIVVVLSLAVAAFLGGIDFLFSELLERFI